LNLLQSSLPKQQTTYSKALLENDDLFRHTIQTPAKLSTTRKIGSRKKAIENSNSRIGMKPELKSTKTIPAPKPGSIHNPTNSNPREFSLKPQNPPRPTIANTSSPTNPKPSPKPTLQDSASPLTPHNNPTAKKTLQKRNFQRPTKMRQLTLTVK
jgi:hypothetical protein